MRLEVSSIPKLSPLPHWSYLPSNLTFQTNCPPRPSQNLCLTLKAWRKCRLSSSPKGTDRVFRPRRSRLPLTWGLYWKIRRKCQSRRYCHKFSSLVESKEAKRRRTSGWTFIMSTRNWWRKRKNLSSKKILRKISMPKISASHCWESKRTNERFILFLHSG